ncbi:hypothetical protein CRE_30139 [Caenorhabditis remanei]|uniref:Uncharacterized protein n=1 Tax=Caenorhabditis remanei TaxID=31234 RepID=E3NAJ9_CAERE|nr:hypothetical protein CRE_30139 [Caenorhabditis remanei]
MPGRLNKFWKGVGNHQFLPDKTGSDDGDGWEIVETEELEEKRNLEVKLKPEVLSDETLPPVAKHSEVSISKFDECDNDITVVLLRRQDAAKQVQHLKRALEAAQSVVAKMKTAREVVGSLDFRLWELEERLKIIVSEEFNWVDNKWKLITKELYYDLLNLEKKKEKCFEFLDLENVDLEEILEQIDVSLLSLGLLNSRILNLHGNQFFTFQNVLTRFCGGIVKVNKTRFRSFKESPGYQNTYFLTQVLKIEADILEFQKRTALSVLESVILDQKEMHKSNLKCKNKLAIGFHKENMKSCLIEVNESWSKLGEYLNDYPSGEFQEILILLAFLTCSLKLSFKELLSFPSNCTGGTKEHYFSLEKKFEKLIDFQLMTWIFHFFLTIENELAEDIEAAKLIVLEKEKVMERFDEFFRDRILNEQEFEMKTMYVEVQKKWTVFISKQNLIMLEVGVLQRFRAPVPVGFEDRVKELSLQSQEICESVGKLTIQSDLLDLSHREPLVQFYASMMGYIGKLRETIGNLMEMTATNDVNYNGTRKEKIFEWATTSGEMNTEFARYLLYIPTDHREDNELQQNREMKQYRNRIEAYETELEVLTTTIWSFLDYE